MGRIARGDPGSPFLVQVGAEQFEDAAMVLAALDQASKDAHEGQARYPQPIGPALPEPGLVDQCLADVEEHRTHRHRIIATIAPHRGGGLGRW